MTPRARLGRLGVAIPEILIPGAATPMETWAVIACDQFSSERSYWEETRRLTAGSPSTLDLIIPECYLEDGDRDERAEAANRSMIDVLEKGLLDSLEPGFILVDRSTPHADLRRGLVLAIDLDAYDFAEGSTSRIRPTEGTIRDRLPPRMAVRRGAHLDLPHILLLVDDPEDVVMQAALSAADREVYDFELLQGGGHLRGRHVPEAGLGPLADALEAIAARSDLLFAVGDGNHSLASAREIWKEKQAEGAPDDHPARYALVEVENIHDPGLHFHPIHRVLFGVDPERIRRALKTEIGAKTADGPSVRIVEPDGSETDLHVAVPPGRLAVEPLQEALDAYLAGHPEADIDYIHGADSVRELVEGRSDRVGLLLPDLDKSSFFGRITDVGPYPRKTFSIGEAVEKRYYLEARRLD